MQQKQKNSDIWQRLIENKHIASKTQTSENGIRHESLQIRSLSITLLFGSVQFSEMFEQRSLLILLSLLILVRTFGFTESIRRRFPHQQPKRRSRGQSLFPRKAASVDSAPPHPRYHSWRETGPGGVVSLRYSDFLKLVDRNKLQKVTFSSDGTQLLGKDKDGIRIRIDALPNDPTLLSELTRHKVDITVLPAEEPPGFFSILSSLFMPIAIFAGLFL